jgi:hypothetical protein
MRSFPDSTSHTSRYTLFRFEEGSMSKFKGITAARPEAIIRTRRLTTIERAEVSYVDGTREVFVIDERGRFRLSALYCGEARRAAGGAR